MTLERVGGPLASGLGLPWPDPSAAAGAVVERILSGLGDEAPSGDVFANFLLGRMPQILFQQFRALRTARAPATRRSHSRITASRALRTSRSRTAMR